MVFRKLNDGLMSEEELQNILQRKQQEYSINYFDSSYYEDQDRQRKYLVKNKLIFIQKKA